MGNFQFFFLTCEVSKKIMGDIYCKFIPSNWTVFKIFLDMNLNFSQCFCS